MESATVFPVVGCGFGYFFRTRESPKHKEIHKKYLTHIDINNLKGMEIEFIYEWKLGESLIVDRSHIHCASTRINHRKLGLTTFTKK